MTLLKLPSELWLRGVIQGGVRSRDPPVARALGDSRACLPALFLAPVGEGRASLKPCPLLNESRVGTGAKLLALAFA